MPESVDLLIEGTVITMDPARRVIRGGRGGARRPDRGGGHRRRRSCATSRRAPWGLSRIVLPGLIDRHNHLAQALVREYAGGLPQHLPGVHPVRDGHGPARRRRERPLRDLAAAARRGHDRRRDHVYRRARGADRASRNGDRDSLRDGTWPGRSHLPARLQLRPGRRPLELQDDPGALREDLAATEEWLARWAVEGEGRLRPYIHNLGLPSCSDERFLATKRWRRATTAASCATSTATGRRSSSFSPR